MIMKMDFFSSELSGSTSIIDNGWAALKVYPWERWQ